MWMELEVIMSNEIRQIQNYNTLHSHLFVETIMLIFYRMKLNGDYWQLGIEGENGKEGHKEFNESFQIQVE